MNMRDLNLSKKAGVILVVAMTFGCGGGGGSSGGISAPVETPIASSSCMPFANGGTAPISSWSITGSSSPYNIQVTLDRTKLNQFKSSTDGCSISKYEISVVGGSKYIVFSSDPRPPIVSGWNQISSSNTYSYTSLNLSSYTQVSLCVRAFSNLSEESSWYCSAKSVPTSGGGGSPPVTDTTAPSAPSSLSLSVPNWSFGSTLYLNFTASTDAQSGISRYWTAILDSSMNQVSPDKEISKYSTSDSFNASSLTAGRTYNYAIMAENGAGLFSSIATAQFYKPIQVTVTLKYNSISAGGCNYPTTANCQSAPKTMFDTQLLSLKTSQYPSCTLTSLGGNTYELDCRSVQNCRAIPIGGYCGGMPATTYNGYCGPVHGAYVNSSSCGSWNPTIPAP